MFRSRKATLVESLSGISGALFSLEHFGRKSRQSALSNRPCLCYSVPKVLLAPRLMTITGPRYLTDCTVGKLTVSVSIYIFTLTGYVSLLSVGVGFSSCS